ncbi:MAG: hypothetical protein K6F92_08220 [Lachnospiraceae bacterium]|nr:hypothetical protein [Lachnospiraceae bacterium]
MGDGFSAKKVIILLIIAALLCGGTVFIINYKYTNHVNMKAEYKKYIEQLKVDVSHDLITAMAVDSAIGGLINSQKGLLIADYPNGFTVVWLTDGMGYTFGADSAITEEGTTDESAKILVIIDGLVYADTNKDELANRVNAESATTAEIGAYKLINAIYANMANMTATGEDYDLVARSYAFVGCNTVGTDGYTDYTGVTYAYNGVVATLIKDKTNSTDYSAIAETAVDDVRNPAYE